MALRLARPLPGVGDSPIDCVRAHLALQVQLSVRPTPNPNFRRIDAAVTDSGVQILRLSTIIGRN